MALYGNRAEIGEFSNLFHQFNPVSTITPRQGVGDKLTARKGYLDFKSRWLP